MKKTKDKRKTKLPGAKREVSPLYAKLLSFEPRRRDMRRALIVEAAIECIGKLGVEDTHFESIGQRSGMGRAHVKYYFKDRDEIVKAAIEFVATTAQMITLECISRANSPKERLQAFVEGAFRWVESYPEHLPVMGLNYYYCMYRPDYQKLHSQIRSLGEERARSLLGELLPKVSSEHRNRAAKAIQNLILGNLLDWSTTKSSVKLSALLDSTQEAVDDYIKGL